MLPTGTVTFEDVLLFLHVLAVVVAFGPTFAYGLFIATADNSDQSAMPTVIRGIRRVDSLLGQSGLAVLIVTGVWLVLDGDLPWDWSQTFVSVGLTAVVVLLAMMLFFFRPRTRTALELAERDLAAGGELSEEFQQLSKRLAAGGQIATLIVLVTIFFMTVKP